MQKTIGPTPIPEEHSTAPTSRRTFLQGCAAILLAQPAAEGPGRIVGGNPFHLTDNVGSGAVMVQTIARRTGKIHVTASHAQLGRAHIRVDVRSAK